MPDASIRDLVREWAERFAGARLDEADVIAEWAVAEALGVGRTAVRAGWPPRAPTPEQQRRLAEIGHRLLNGEPLAYVAGWTSFRGLRLRVDPRALIPRPETEELVTRVLNYIPRQTGARILDVGTGCGCIALALAAECPSAQVDATDCSAEALALARENAEQLGLADRVKLHQRDLFGLEEAPWDLIVSNPPYVARSEWPSLPPQVRNWEPRVALDGGEDGLAVIRRLIPAARTSLRPGGWCWLEIGETQGPAVVELFHRSGFEDIQIWTDLRGRPRLAGARCP